MAVGKRSIASGFFIGPPSFSSQGLISSRLGPVNLDHELILLGPSKLFFFFPLILETDSGKYMTKIGQDFYARRP